MVDVAVLVVVVGSAAVVVGAAVVVRAAAGCRGGADVVVVRRGLGGRLVGIGATQGGRAEAGEQDREGDQHHRDRAQRGA